MILTSNTEATENKVEFLNYHTPGADPGGGAQGALAPPSLTHTPHTPTCDTHKAQTCNTASI